MEKFWRGKLLTQKRLWNGPKVWYTLTTKLLYVENDNHRQQQTGRGALTNARLSVTICYSEGNPSYDKVAVETGMKKEVVRKLFSKHKHSVLNPATLIACACRKKGSGRKNKISPNELQTMVKSIPP